MITLFALSPINKQRIPVGQVDIRSRTASFFISEKRLFQAADCVGIDRDILKRKAMEWCDKIVFKMFDGRIYRISKQDFLANAWLYPPSPVKPIYKASREIFKAKWMIRMDKLEKLSQKQKEAEDLEMLKAAVM